MKAFVTGGTGFIGSRLIRRLVERGYEVAALARSEKGAVAVEALGARSVRGDLDDIESMRIGMQGSDVVFHVAGWYKLGSQDLEMCEKVNVDGTRNVLSLAHELGIPKIVYTSTVAVFGDTHGALVDETYHMPAGQEFLTEYDRTKWKAHYEVAIPLIEKGAPIIIVQPGGVYGPDDHSLLGELMRWYHQGLFPIFPAPELALTYAHVEDIAEGHILAAEKGEPGESYILAGPALSVIEAARLWSRVSGRPEPFFSIPARFLKPFAPLMGVIGRFVPLPELFSQDSLSILSATYTARADKARSELGWQPRPLEEGMRETFEWIRQAEAQPAQVLASTKRIGILAASAGFGLFFLWLLSRKRRRD
jgi:nucleoside-diphosphate-sugar epimerase